MRAVKGTGAGVAVFDVDEPPGTGTLLVMTAAGSRMGAEAVSVAARHPPQREAAERSGARVGADGCYDVVIEAAGSPESLARAIDLVAPRGTVVVLGVHLGTVELNWMPLFHR